MYRPQRAGPHAGALAIPMGLLGLETVQTGGPRLSLPSGRPRLEVLAHDFDRQLAGELLDRMGAVLRGRSRVVVAILFGNTPRGVFQYWREARAFPWGRVSLVAVDEYVGAGADHPQGGTYQLWREVVKPLTFFGLNPRNCRLIDGMAEDPVAEARDHDQFVRDHGGLDIAFLGIGRGPEWNVYQWMKFFSVGGRWQTAAMAASVASVHLGFCERGSAFDSETRVVRLPRVARSLNGVDFTHAITLGLKVLLGAQQIVGAAKGERKRSAVDLALYGPMTRLIPASSLQLNPAKTTIYVDPAADPRRG